MAFLANPPVLELRGVTKRYGPITVLHGIDFDLQAGEVHGLIGTNGAGKSTTVKLLSGVFHDYEGEMRIRGKTVRFRSPAEAQDIGIGMVYQELSVFPHLTVAENLFGRKPPCRLGLLDRKRMLREAQRHLNELGIEIDATRRVGELPVGSQQGIEIARVVFSGANIIILDEPTSALSAPEIQRLFELIHALKAQGKSIIFISHFLDDVLAISDRVTTLRDGRKMSTLPAPSANKQQLVEQMLGEDANALPAIHASEERSTHTPQEVVLTVDDFTVQDEFEHVSFILHRGEVFGLFGFMGAGQVQVGRCLFGVRGVDSGTARLEGTRLNLSNTTAATTSGIAYVPENRHESLMLRREVYTNITLVHLKKIVGWLLQRKVEIATATRSIARLAIRPPDPLMPVGELSGGNQQKVVLAKWLIEQPRLLILTEPTRGIDVAAQKEVMQVILQLRDQGVPILLISSEPEIVVRMADRAAVMRKGRMTAELRGAQLTQTNLMHHA